MITIYYSTAKKLNKFLEFQDEFESNCLLLKDFQNLEFGKFELIKLLEENKDIDIFITIQASFRNDVNAVHDILKAINYLEKVVTYINHQHLENSRINQIKQQFQDRIRCFDVKGFINENIQTINDLTKFQLDRADEKNNKILPTHNVENILSKDRSRNLVFIRQTIQYLLLNCGGSTVVVGKVIGKDHSTIVHGREMFDNYLQYYATLREFHLLNELKTKMENILDIEHKKPICKI